MKHLLAAGLLALAALLAACGSSTDGATAVSGSEGVASTEANGCTAGGLDAMTVLSEFQLKMDEAEKAGTITTEQLLRWRDKLFTETQAAQEKGDWVAYCKVIDDARADLKL